MSSDAVKNRTERFGFRRSRFQVEEVVACGAEDVGESPCDGFCHIQRNTRMMVDVTVELISDRSTESRLHLLCLLCQTLLDEALLTTLLLSSMVLLLLQPLWIFMTQLILSTQTPSSSLSL